MLKVDSGEDFVPKEHRMEEPINVNIREDRSGPMFNEKTRGKRLAVQVNENKL